MGRKRLREGGGEGKMKEEEIEKMGGARWGRGNEKERGRKWRLGNGSLRGKRA